MAKQLTFMLTSSAFDPEALLAQLSQMREDVPSGMSRLAG